MNIRDRIKELRRVPAADLRPNPKNWRTHPKAQADAMRGLLAEIGFAGAALARECEDGTLMLIDGHLRAEVNPGGEIPVLVLDVSEAEADKILATFDPVSAMAGADPAKLDAILREVETSSEDVAKMLDDLAKDAGCEWAKGGGEVIEDAVPEPPVEPFTRPGDLWILGEHRLLCGDSTKAEDVGRVLNGDKCDCVFTSPPYGVGVDYGGYDDTIENLRAMLSVLPSLWTSHVHDGGFAVVNFGDIIGGRKAAGTEEVCEYPMALEYWPAFRKAGWTLWSRRIWCKPNARVAAPWCASSNRAASDWEHVWTWKMPGPPIVMRQDRSQMGWFDTSKEAGVDVGKNVHGAGMAMGAAARMIDCHTRKSAIVLEPFCGTGTTLIAAEQLGRKCYGMEISPQYCDVILRRWAKLTGRVPVREDGVEFPLGVANG